MGIRSWAKMGNAARPRDQWRWALALVLLPSPALAAGDPSLALTLAPQSEGSNAEIGQLAVTMRLTDSAVTDGVLVSLPHVVTNVDTNALGLRHVTARDESGPLPLTVRDFETSAGTIRQWVVARPARGPVTLTFTAPAFAPAGTRGAAPPLELRNDAGAVSGNLGILLPLPHDDRPYRFSLDWALPGDAGTLRAASSLGLGDRTAPDPMALADIRRVYVMAGRIGTYPDAAAAPSGFFAAWQGQPGFAIAPLMAWTETLYGHYGRLFSVTEPQPYGVFMRMNPVNPGGGIGQYHSFVTTFGEQRGNDPEELKFTLAHEMFHTLQPYITDPDGLASSWFNEGLAVFYQRTLPLRFGMITPDAFLADLNFHAARLYTSIKADTPNDQIPSRFWADTRVRTLPYDRGSMYLATIDWQMRSASGGAKSLDDLMLAMLSLQKQGPKVSVDDWRELLRRELGEEAARGVDRALAGEIPLPESDAFGPCFRRTTKDLKRYDLGFAPEALVSSPRIIRGLVPGSAAEEAGLREGDEILRPVGQDGLQGEQAGVLTLAIRRDGIDRTISYVPRGETVAAWQWERVPGVPDDRCAR
ncbi:hypothetical protein [Sphingomonas sp. 35-24ZXX]|uniref:hypothetical protein n=1 Tax=Sphingomonas sp. 35-24ZXX TaxID=1545915 RepID=UPI00068C35DD|nr:hypothetical protein [Sphingomonas sp. 35-24ZXX]